MRGVERQDEAVSPGLLMAVAHVTFGHNFSGARSISAKRPKARYSQHLA